VPQPGKAITDKPKNGGWKLP